MQLVVDSISASTLLSHTIVLHAVPPNEGCTNITSTLFVPHQCVAVVSSTLGFAITIASVVDFSVLVNGRPSYEHGKYRLQVGLGDLGLYRQVSDNATWRTVATTMHRT